MQKLSEYNIGYGLHFPPAHTLSYVDEKYYVDESLLPQTNRAADKILSLPLFPDMTREDVQYVCEAVREILKNA